MVAPRLVILLLSVNNLPPGLLDFLKVFTLVYDHLWTKTMVNYGFPCTKLKLFLIFYINKVKWQCEMQQNANVIIPTNIYLLYRLFLRP